MTNETPNSPVPPTERARIEPSPPMRRVDMLPGLYLVGFLVLAGALAYLWQHPAASPAGAADTARVDTLRQQVEALTARVAQIEARPAAATPPVALAPLEARVAALEKRPAAVPAPPAAPAPNLAPLEARLAALEARPVPSAAPPVDLAPVQQKIDAVAKQGMETVAALNRRVDQVETRVTTTETQSKEAAAGVGAAAERSQRAVRLQAVSAALDAGLKLGAIPGGAPALARFATEAPPTMASLRLAFNAAAEAAHVASQPDITDNQPFLQRAWIRAQQAITVRQGDKVIVGDPIAGVIEHARTLLEAGDLAGTVKVLDTGLTPSAKAAMAGWIGQAKALLDARAALAELAARS